MPARPTRTSPIARALTTGLALAVLLATVPAGAIGRSGKGKDRTAAARTGGAAQGHGANHPAQRRGFSLGGTRAGSELARPSHPTATRPLAKAAAKRVKPAKTSRATLTRAVLQGTAKGGPAHMGHAIRHRPWTFAAGFVAMGALGGALKLIGLPAEAIVIGLSGTALGAQLGLTVPELRRVKGAERGRLIGSHMLFPTLVFVASTFVGHEVSHMIPHADGLMDTLRAFVNGAIVAADVPPVGLTAWETFRELRAIRKAEGRPGLRAAREPNGR